MEETYRDTYSKYLALAEKGALTMEDWPKEPWNADIEDYSEWNKAYRFSSPWLLRKALMMVYVADGRCQEEIKNQERCPNIGEMLTRRHFLTRGKEKPEDLIILCRFHQNKWYEKTKEENQANTESTEKIERDTLLEEFKAVEYTSLSSKERHEKVWKTDLVNSEIILRYDSRPAHKSISIKLRKKWLDAIHTSCGLKPLMQISPAIACVNDGIAIRLDLVDSKKNAPGSYQIQENKTDYTITVGGVNALTMLGDKDREFQLFPGHIKVDGNSLYAHLSEV